MTENESQHSPDTLQRLLEAKKIYGYEPNHLTDSQLQQVDNRISEVLGAASHEEADLIQELQTFLRQQQGLFPELSHGSSSDAVPSVIRHGLRPRREAIDLVDSEIHRVGEGMRSNLDRRFTHRANEVYFGLGQGGLGTTLAYALAVSNDQWNYNQLSAEEISALQQEYQGSLEKIKDRDREAVLVLEERLERLAAAEKRLDRGIAPDYPVLVGVSGTVNPDSPDIRLMTETRQGVRQLAFTEGLDSEVAVKDPEFQQPPRIIVMAAPLEQLAKLRQQLSEQGRDDIRTVSLEALKLIKKLGFDRVGQAYDQATVVLDYALYKGDRYIQRALEELARGDPPFDYENYEP